jgi:hypothetical protein
MFTRNMGQESLLKRGNARPCDQSVFFEAGIDRPCHHDALAQCRRSGCTVPFNSGGIRPAVHTGWPFECVKCRLLVRFRFDHPSARIVDVICKEIHMETNLKRLVALRILDSAGVSRQSSSPPLWRALWRVNINIPPPHFMPFWALFSISGGVFGALLYCFLTLHQRNSVIYCVHEACWAGILFGVSMAALIDLSKRKHKLPAWRDLDRH